MILIRLIYLKTELAWLKTKYWILKNILDLLVAAFIYRLAEHGPLERRDMLLGNGFVMVGYTEDEESQTRTYRNAVGIRIIDKTYKEVGEGGNNASIRPERI